MFKQEVKRAKEKFYKEKVINLKTKKPGQFTLG